MSDLVRLLHYPWRDEGWLRRMLPVALLQLIPLVGQIILVGYGQAIVRATYRQQSDLPRLQLRRAFVDGLRLVGIGTVYCLPVILTVLLAFSTIDTPETEASGGVPSIVYPIIMFSYLRISSEVMKRRPALKSILSWINRFIVVIFVISIIFRLFNLFSTLQGGLQFSAIQLNSSSIMTLLVASLLMAVISGALLVSGVRFTITGSGLLKPATTLQLMVANHKQSLRFVLTVWLLAAGTLMATVVGAVFLLLPGLLLFVAGNISIWFLAAQYAVQIAIAPSSDFVRHEVT